MEDVATRLSERLDRFMSEGTAPEDEDRGDLTDEQRHMLEELGYLQ